MASVVLLLLVSRFLNSVKGFDPFFVEQGSDVLLDIKGATVKTDEDFSWKFNTTVLIVKFNANTEPRVHDKYKDRADFFAQNFSLLLRNVQHNDSGNYKAVKIDSEEHSLAEFTVRVQDRVSPVSLTLTPVNRDFCNFTATCKTLDSKINLTVQCENKTCLDQTHLTESSLSVYVKESFIICNHSNHVSWEQDVKAVSSVCEKETVFNTAFIVGISVGTVASGFLLVLIICVIIFCLRNRARTNTVYEVPQETQTQNPYVSPADVAPPVSPTSTYALVQFPHPELCENNSIQHPETIYAQVNRAIKDKAKSATANR